MVVTRVFEIDHAATFAKDSTAPREWYGVIQVEGHLDPSIWRLSSPMHGAGEELRKMTEEDGGGGQVSPGGEV